MRLVARTWAQLKRLYTRPFLRFFCYARILAIFMIAYPFVILMKNDRIGDQYFVRRGAAAADGERGP